MPIKFIEFATGRSQRMLKESTKQILLTLKSELVGYYTAHDLNENDNVEYLINMLDLIINGDLDLNKENYSIILEEILITSTRNKNNEFIRIIQTYTGLGKELACQE